MKKHEDYQFGQSTVFDYMQYLNDQVFNDGDDVCRYNIVDFMHKLAEGKKGEQDAAKDV